MFFERVDPKVSLQATFVLELVNAKTGERMDQVELAFDVIP